MTTHLKNESRTLTSENTHSPY